MPLGARTVRTKHFRCLTMLTFTLLFYTMVNCTIDAAQRRTRKHLKRRGRWTDARECLLHVVKMVPVNKAGNVSTRKGQSSCDGVRTPVTCIKACVRMRVPL